MKNYPLHLLFKRMHYITISQTIWTVLKILLVVLLTKRMRKKSLKRNMSDLKATDDEANKPVLQCVIVSCFCFQAHSKVFNHIIHSVT